MARNAMTVQLQRLSRYRRGLSDGLHADPLSNPSYNVYFRCSSQALAALHHCPPHTLFLEAGLGSFREEEDSSEGACVSEDEFRRVTRLRKVGASLSVEVPAGFNVEGRGDANSAYPSGGHRGVSLREVAGVSRAVGLLKAEPAAAAGAGAAELAGGAGGGEGAGGTGESMGAMRSQLEVNPQAGGSGASSQAASSSPTSSSAPPPDPQALAELNALLAFKASVIVFDDLLASWVVPRSAFSASSAPSANSASSVSSASSPASPDPYSFLCAWRFVTCSPARPGGERRVVGLSMTRFGPDLDQRPVLMLTRRSVVEENWDGSGAASGGGSSGDFSALTALTNLTLHNNRDYREMAGLIGAFPSHLAACSSLQVLSLSGHRLLGPIPDSISLFSSLQHLELAYNLMSGQLPTALASLSHLTNLNLEANNFSGEITPRISRLAKMLVNLNLGQNSLSGSLPSELGQLTNLGNGPFLAPYPGLYLHRNLLSGLLPESLSSLSSLQALDLSSNNLSGPIPQKGSFFTSFNNLILLSLSHNQLSGPLPLQNGCGMSLYLVQLGSNRFTGGLPADLSSCYLLYSLDVSSNLLSGQLSPAFFTSLAGTSVGEIYLMNNSFEGNLPSEIGDVVTLGVLDASSNRLSGKLPELNSCPSMIYLANNSFSGRIPAGFICPSLTALDLSNNSLSGDLPEILLGPLLLPSLSPCPRLQSFNVSHNSLTGTLDTITTQLRPSPIFTLGLAGNLLEGPVPASIGNLISARAIDVSDNRLSGSLPPTLSQLQVLRSLSFSGNNLSSHLSSEISALSLLTSLDVSRNIFNGPIPPQLAPPFLPRLLYLNLSHNHFFGAIPYGFSNTNTSATALDFSYNDLLGQIPFNTTGTGTPLPASALQGNLGLCGGFGYASCPVAPYESTGGFSPGAIAGIAVGCAAFVAALLVLLVLLWLWLFARRRGPSLDGGTMLVFEKLGFKLTVTDVVDATEDFSNKFLLGRGGFGSVYRATLQDGRSVAIKRLALGSSQGQREFEAEMNTLGNVRHRNLVVLVAAYLSPPPAQERLLIYDFLPGGSLDQVLAREMGKDSPMRRWAVRRNILEGTARALKYLHQDCTPGIIHRDMKPANILLDENLEAKVADFGLAREADASRTHMSTSVFGTVGYLSPEYSQRGRLSFKSDVFAFGVLVLQVITGKLPTDSDVAERGLARWVGMHTVASFVDERIDDALLYEDEIMGVVTLALQCTQTVPADRPSMPEALEVLENLHDFAKGIRMGIDAKEVE
ncbi:unnamed protein product [Closterium sp. Yama58-4]|nr:unnamed protein product [Closterium sp. Yama58-4]